MNNKDKLEALVRIWRKEAEMLLSISENTWQMIQLGNLPKDTAVVHSVYEQAAEANILRHCALALEMTLREQQ